MTLLTVYIPGTGSDDYDSGRNLKDYEWKDLADDIARNIPQGKVAVYPIDWGGKRKLDILSEYLSKRFIIGDTLLQNNKEDEYGEYREILTPARDVKINGTGYGIVFDDWIGGDTGQSAIGGLLWLLDNSEELGISKSYLGGMVDWSRIAPFAGRRKYSSHEYIGQEEGLRERAPKAFERLEEKYKESLYRKIGKRKFPVDQSVRRSSRFRRRLRELLESDPGANALDELFDTVK